MIPSFTEIETDDRNRLRDIIAELADSSNEAKQWFRDIVTDSDLPPKFKQTIKGTFQGNAPSDASRLINYAFSRGVQPGKPKFTALGAVLKTVLESDIGVESAQSVAALIVKYRMFRDPLLLSQLNQRFGIPESMRRAEDADEAIGSWLGPEPVGSSRELQSFFKPQLDFFDAGFLERGMRCAGSVCRVEIPAGNPMGTGFLVADDKVLTNFHVVKMRDSDNLELNARSAVLRFRNVTAPTGQESKGQIFRMTSATPVLASSPASEMDFALLHVEPLIKSSKDIWKVPFSVDVPCRGAALNILQHAHGGPLSFAFSRDGVRDVFEKLGLIQYVTPASNGSSGSPCFNDSWEVVALHHAERSRSFGSIREGILMSKILPSIRHRLD